MVSATKSDKGESTTGHIANSCTIPADTRIPDPITIGSEADCCSHKDVGGRVSLVSNQRRSRVSAAAVRILSKRRCFCGVQRGSVAMKTCPGDPSETRRAAAIRALGKGRRGGEAAGQGEEGRAGAGQGYHTTTPTTRTPPLYAPLPPPARTPGHAMPSWCTAPATGLNVRWVRGVSGGRRGGGRADGRTLGGRRKRVRHAYSSLHSPHSRIKLTK